jgi:hypothetical protein
MWKEREARQGVVIEGRMACIVHTTKDQAHPQEGSKALRLLKAQRQRSLILGPLHGRAEEGIFAGMLKVGSGQYWQGTEDILARYPHEVRWRRRLGFLPPESPELFPAWPACACGGERVKKKKVARHGKLLAFAILLSSKHAILDPVGGASRREWAPRAEQTVDEFNARQSENAVC